MNKIYLVFCLCFILFACSSSRHVGLHDQNLLSYVVDPQQQRVAFFLKDPQGQNFKSLANLKNWLASQNKSLLFAMNGGMYTAQSQPLGLYIENSQLITPLNKQQKGYGNFYLQPNGVFYLDSQQRAKVVASSQFKLTKDITYATQSGPMLVVDGKIHSKLIPNSNSKKVRNGVGVLPDGRVLFVMSKVPVNFYEFAQYFKDQGCEQALYLDGVVSRTYLPEKNWVQLDGEFGVVMAVVE